MGIIEEFTDINNGLFELNKKMEKLIEVILNEKQPEDRTKVEEKTKDSLTKNDGEDVTHNTGKVNKDG